MDGPDQDGKATDAAALTIIADRLRDIDEGIGDELPFLRYLVQMAYLEALEALSIEKNDR